MLQRRRWQSSNAPCAASPATVLSPVPQYRASVEAARYLGRVGHDSRRISVNRTVLAAVAARETREGRQWRSPARAARAGFGTNVPQMHRAQQGGTLRLT